MKAAIYCRLSEEDRNKEFETDDSGNIQNQKAMLLGYANEPGWELYDIYSDDDYTGSDRRRPEFNRFLKDAEERKSDRIQAFAWPALSTAQSQEQYPLEILCDFRYADE